MRAAEAAAKVSRGGLPEARYDELRAEARREVEDGRPKLTATEQKVLDEWTLSSTETDEPDSPSENLVIAAVLLVPQVLWLMFRLAKRTGGRGPAPARKLVAATILHMAFHRGRPEVWETSKAFIGNGLLGWAFRYPSEGETAPDRGGFYEAVHEVLAPQNLDPELLEHLQVETFKQLAQQTVTGPRGKKRPRHPKAGVGLVVDGSFTQGQADQSPIVDEEHRLSRIRGRKDRDGIRFRLYGRDGHFWRSVVGYKLIAIVCACTGRPIITTVVPANHHEPDAVLYLLKRLFELWPDCPAEYLIGDGLYGHGLGFLRQVMFKFGLDPVFPWRADYPRTGIVKDHPVVKGVPICTCLGEDRPRPMKFLQRKGAWWGAERRRKRGLPRGEWVPDADKRMRYEFVCPDAASKHKGGCKPQYTYPWDDPRVHTYLPHVGGCQRAATRKALLGRRNVVESFYASLQRQGMQGRGVERPAWANDVEVNWMLGFGALFLTARRLVFENGLYDRVLAEAEGAGFLDVVTRDNTVPGPTPEQAASIDAARRGELPPPAPPASWTEARGPEQLTGSGARWADECGYGSGAPAARI